MVCEARGVVRALACVVAIVVLNAASVSLALAQGPPSGGSRVNFATGWQNGTPLTVTGELTVFYADDFANHRADLVHMVRDERTGRSFQLRFDKEPAHLRSGAVVTITGRASAAEIYVLADQISPVSPASSGTGSTTVAAPTVAGDQKTLVIVAGFRDKSVSCPIQAIDNVMFADPLDKSVDDLYRDMSMGQVSFTGTVVGPYTLGSASTDPCDISGWATAANTAASSGIDVNAYARKVYVMPSNSCPAAGIAEVGVTPSRAWVFTCDIADVYAHELGHNLGMQHAATPTSEYADDSDIMGQAEGLLRQVNAPHKLEMGWIPDAQAARVTEDGQYEIAPTEVDPALAAAPQALKVFKVDSNEYYYLSYRRGIGFDSNLACCAYLDRLSVHRWSGPGNKTYRLAVLADGETFSDPATGFTVTQVRHSSTSSTALVRVGNGCGSAVPSLVLSPANQSAPAGSAASYDVALVNNDASTCAASTFVLAGSVPSGWTSTFSPASVQVAPGGTVHAMLSLVSPNTASPGTYGLIVTTSDPNVAVHTASATGSYTAVASCTRNAPGVGISPASQSAPPGTKVNYSLTVTNNDTPACAATTFNLVPSVPTGWIGTLSSSAATLTAGASVTVTYWVTSAPGSAAGTYGIWSNAADATLGRAVSANASEIIVSDTVPPAPPAGLMGTVDRKQVKLAWQASTDNVAVVGYRVWRNGTVIATATTASWIDSTALANVAYTYAVAAYDAAQNVSALSNSAVVKITSGGKK
jgi:hypothetical protein